MEVLHSGVLFQGCVFFFVVCVCPFSSGVRFVWGMYQLAEGFSRFSTALTHCKGCGGYLTALVIAVGYHAL